MKKVLIIANLYHASPRIPSVTAYLPEFGWSATIITPAVNKNFENNLASPGDFFDKVKLVNADYRGDVFWLYRKIFKLFKFNTGESITEQIKERIGTTSKRSFIDNLLNFYQCIFAYPDTEITWQKEAFRKVEETIKKNSFQALMSSSPFPTSHMVAFRVKEKFGIPWLADFRDPWTQNHNYPFGRLRKFFEQKLEKKILKQADVLTAAAPSYAEKQEKLTNKKTFVVTNGFDPGTLNDLKIPLTKKFSITYTGSIYSGKQDPEIFFIALRELLSERIFSEKEIEVRFYGPRYSWFEALLKKYELKSVVGYYGFISRSESLKKQKESQILLLLNWEDAEEKGVYPLKFFEYMAGKRPILAACGFPGQDVEKMITQTQSGIYASGKEEIKKALLKFYTDYKKDGEVPYNGNIKEINKYSYREKARQFAELLDGIAENKQ